MLKYKFCVNKIKQRRGGEPGDEASFSWELLEFLFMGSMSLSHNKKCLCGVREGGRGNLKASK